MSTWFRRCPLCLVWMINNAGVFRCPKCGYMYDYEGGRIQHDLSTWGVERWRTIPLPPARHAPAPTASPDAQE